MLALTMLLLLLHTEIWPIHTQTQQDHAGEPASPAPFCLKTAGPPARPALYAIYTSTNIHAGLCWIYFSRNVSNLELNTVKPEEREQITNE